MNRVREIAKEQGRTLVWIAKQINKTRMGMNWKIDNDSFTAAEREAIALALGVAVGEVFPASGGVVTAGVVTVGENGVEEAKEGAR